MIVRIPVSSQVHRLAGTLHICVWRRKFPKRLWNKLTRNASEITVDVSDREAVICLLLILAMIVLAYQNCPHDMLKVIVSSRVLSFIIY
jgi:hypothetical protein